MASGEVGCKTKTHQYEKDVGGGQELVGHARNYSVKGPQSGRNSIGWNLNLLLGILKKGSNIVLPGEPTPETFC